MKSGAEGWSRSRPRSLAAVFGLQLGLCLGPPLSVMHGPASAAARAAMRHARSVAIKGWRLLPSIFDDAAMATFTRKCELLGYLRRVPPILPLLIADRFTREAFRVGRSRGIMMATPGTLFGREVAQGFASLVTALTRAAAVTARNPEVIGELFEKLSGIEGAASNLTRWCAGSNIYNHGSLRSSFSRRCRCHWR